MTKRARNIQEVVTISDKKTVYIAGKVSGLPYSEVYIKFRTASLKLEAAGYSVINPVELVAEDADWIQAMRICISFLPHADYIYLLPDWQDSNGAKVEKQLADVLKIDVLSL